MNGRYEVHPSDHGKPPGDNFPSFWHKRAGNSEITAVSQRFTRHSDAVDAVRTDVWTTAEILGISRAAFEQLYAPDLTYFDASYGPNGLPVYEEKPLYPELVTKPAEAVAVDA